MSKEQAESCWDCPDRTGISRLTGKIACKFFGHPMNRNVIAKQRGDCAGPTAMYDTSGDGQGYFEDDGVTVTETWIYDDHYSLKCPQTTIARKETPVEVTRAMAANRLTGFVHRTVKVIEHDAAEYHEKYTLPLARIANPGMETS